MNKQVKHIILRSGREGDIFLGWTNNYSSLKQNSLLFDQIGLLRLTHLRQVMSSAIKSKDNELKSVAPQLQTGISESEWLEEKGIIFEPKIEDDIRFEDFQKIFETNSVAAAEIEELYKILKYELGRQKPRSSLDKFSLAREKDGILTRMASIIMEASRKVSVVTTLPYIEYTSKIPNTRTSDVAQIVINNLPLPNNETPWEQIIDYRNDSETQKHLLSLRRWISRTSTQNLSSLEIEEEIESLINDFQEHIKFHKMKANAETLEVLVNSSVDVLGNLLTLKFSKILNPLFAIKKRQLSLLEAEMNAPGKEMAYIIKSREAFPSQE